tara:strand:- start:120 stop:227 length:108 start_codon:yes stop_codon:yes gene_type:complete
MTIDKSDTKLNPQDKEHLIKAELIEKLSPYYDFHE